MSADSTADSPQRTRRTRRKYWLVFAFVSLVSLVVIQRATNAQAPDWNAAGAEATRLLQEYVRIDTSNPPGDTRRAADFLASVLAREGIPVTRYESAPGKAIVYARLKATMAPAAGKAIVLLHHMDVVPADRSQWKVDPFAATIDGGEMRARGAFDMKGLGVAHLMAFLMLKRQHVPLARDVILLAEPDEEVGGAMGARWMIANHYAELDPEFVLDEGGFGSPDLFAVGKLVYGISVAEKKILWLKVRATGVAGHGSQPHDQNPNDRLVRALARLLGEPLPGPSPSSSPSSAASGLMSTMRERIGVFAVNRFTNAIQHSTIAVTTIRSGVGDPPKVNVIPSSAEATLDCRVLPGTTREAWLAEIRRRLGDPGLEIEVIYESDDSIVSPQDTPLYRNLEAAIHRRHPDAVITPILVPYGTDSNAFRPRGVTAYGIFPASVSADAVSSMHGDAEHLRLDAVTEAAQVFFETLKATLADVTK
jgi:acetylornithine deacetylase/succinyl-diaminopimelate desuccinylase-like protein